MINFQKLKYFICLLLLTFSLIITTEKLSVNAQTKNNTSQINVVQVAINEKDDLDFMTNLGLMKGHLIVGKELLELGEYEQAQPHFGHPVDEIYELLKPQLSARNLADFKQSLVILFELVKFTPQDNKVMIQYDLVMKQLDQVIASLPENKQQSPDFILKVIKKLLITAQEEYSESIIDNQIVENIEYQDARGFVLYSDILYQNINKILAKKDSQLERKLSNSLTEIKQAFPTPLPPENPIKSPDEMSKLITNFNS